MVKVTATGDVITMLIFHLLKYNKRFPVTQKLTCISEWQQLRHTESKICVPEKVLHRVYMTKS